MPKKYRAGKHLLRLAWRSCQEKTPKKGGGALFQNPNGVKKLLEALKPSANLGTRVGGGASGATSQLTFIPRKQ